MNLIANFACNEGGTRNEKGGFAKSCRDTPIDATVSVCSLPVAEKTTFQNRPRECGMISPYVLPGIRYGARYGSNGR